MAWAPASVCWVASGGRLTARVVPVTGGVAAVVAGLDDGGVLEVAVPTGAMGRCRQHCTPTPTPP